MENHLERNTVLRIFLYHRNHLRQLAIMLELIFQLRKFFDNRLPLWLLVLEDRTNRPMDIVNS